VAHYLHAIPSHFEQNTLFETPHTASLIIGSISRHLLPDKSAQCSVSDMEHSPLRSKFHWLINDAFQMMFVSGETADVAPETTSMIEFIVQQQVMEMVRIPLCQAIRDCSH
jgi:hypothetical protein